MTRKSSVLYAIALVLNLAVCWSIALLINSAMDEEITNDAITEQLDFVFGDDKAWLDDELYPLRGHVKHGALFRKAHIAGWSKETIPVYHAEDVLKVGWPFTTVRGFAHTVGEEVTYINAIALGGQYGASQLNFFPASLRTSHAIDLTGDSE